MDYIKGIDVSVIQGNINWQAVANSGIQFAIMRCGVGNGGIDIDYTKNIAGAKAVGLKVMAYHFVYPLPNIPSQPLRDPIKQAQYHFNAAQGELAACDLEWPAPQDWTKWNCNAKQINDWGLAYLAEYSRLDNRKMVVYTYPYFSQAVNLTDDYSQYPLWIASYQANPSIPNPWRNVGWTLWQTTGGSGHLPNGAPVDTDVVKDLSLWDPPTGVTPPPPPVQPSQPTDPLVNIFNNIWSNISKIIKK